MATLEICTNSYPSALAAQRGGAQRVELCDNMAEGGTTPSYAQIKLCLDRLSIEIWPILRPRGGDFLYSSDEFELMKIDLQNAKNLGCHGMVTGILMANGHIDKTRCKELVDLAKPMPLAFHRAFDMSANLSQSLEDVIEAGFVRILTSGGQPNVDLGTAMLTKLVLQAKGRIQIMPGAGVNAKNIAQLAAQTQASSFHSSARAKVASKMQFRNADTKMGNIDDEYAYEQSDESLVAEMSSILKNL